MGHQEGHYYWGKVVSRSLDNGSHKHFVALTYRTINPKPFSRCKPPPVIASCASFSGSWSYGARVLLLRLMFQRFSAMPWGLDAFSVFKPRKF